MLLFGDANIMPIFAMPTKHRALCYIYKRRTYKDIKQSIKFIT